MEQAYRAGGGFDYEIPTAAPMALAPPIEPKAVEVHATINVVYKSR